MGLTEQVDILAGIIVPRSAGMLKYMNANVPGVEVPDKLISRMAAASDARAEGIAVAVELINTVRDIPGIKGVHLQTIEFEELLPEVIQGAGLLPRPKLSGDTG